MILSDLLVMGKRKRLRECSLIFIMGKLKFRGYVWMEQIGSKWLYNGLFLMYSTPDIIALIGEVQILSI